MRLTKKYRIKDATSCKKLEAMARSVNFVWNYCNEVSVKALDYNNKWLTPYDLCKLTAGCTKELKLVSRTVEMVCDEYAKKRRQYKKRRLKWRGKKSLGWVPFRTGGIHYINNGQIIYCGIKLKFWESRLPENIKSGSFNQDSRGRWYLNLVCEVPDYVYLKTGNDLGVDLGLKTTATYSDGDKFEGLKPTRLYADKLSKVQRAKKKKQVANIHAKISNIRKDSIHKETTRLVKEYDNIFVGNISSKKLSKTRMAKSVYDVSWGAYKTLLAYKTIRFGKVMKVVNESWTSRTCSNCGSLSDWSGLSGLSVREWNCSCGSSLNRDVNAAINILRLGHQTPIKGVRIKTKEVNHNRKST